MHPSIDKDSYLYVMLEDRKQYRVHRLVCIAFHPKIKGKDWVDHIKEDKSNYRADNVRWCTSRENTHFYYNKKGHTTCVTFNKHRHKWVVKVYLDNKHTHIGSFDLEEQGIEAYQYYLDYGSKAARLKYLRR